MKKNILITLSVLAAVIVITLIILPDSEPQLNEDAESLKTSEVEVVTNAHKINTIASVWQWEVETVNANNDQETTATSGEQVNDMSSQLPFTQESVFKALHAVKLDSNNDIILDDDALIALNNALDFSEVKLDGEAIEKLKDLIRKGLPGYAGEQTAQIVGDYYQFLGAKNEFNALYETKDPEVQSIEDSEAQYEELKSLRELYLGADVSEKLFASSDANSRYMFESMKLEANNSLSDEEKKQAQAKIVERHAEDSININNWNERYQEFLNDKRYIVNSSIGDNEKRIQLRALMHEHFSHEELEYVSHLQLDSL
jgi:hypothetical protein